MMRIVPASLAIALLAAAPALGNPDLPRPASLEPDVQFWLRIYTEVGTDGGLIHDSRDLAVIYETVQFSHGSSSRARDGVVEDKKKGIVSVLNRLAKGKRSGLSREEKRILSLFPAGVSNSTLSAATDQVRFQLGQSDKFRAGVQRSGEWLPHIHQILKDSGLPLDLAALPHVESSFTPTAYSRVGAAGLWQFTRSTGQRFMRIDHVIDERLDPYKASEAAARLLKQNRQVTGSWPLAITAYNHGASGMRRAASKLGTRDITTVLRQYKSRTFGFASRNFYVEFLAAAEIARDPERFFGRVRYNQPIAYATAKLPYYTTPNALSRALGVDSAVLKRSNPALLGTVWREAKYIPKGFEIRVPSADLSQPLDYMIAKVPSSKQYAGQTRDLYYTIRRGDNLSEIARRHDTSVSELMALNGLASPNRIRAGQKLRLPEGGGGGSTHAFVAMAGVPSDGLYKIRQGDTLNGISQRYGVSESDLMALNELPNRHRIQVGQLLRVAPEQQLARSEPMPPPAPDPAPVVLAEAEPVKPAEEIVEPEITIASAAPAAVAMDMNDERDLQDALLADPSDYSVAGDGTIEVQSTETLGHFADWLEIKTNRLRTLNHLRYGRPLPLKTRIALDFSRVTPDVFEHRRMEYHRSLQEAFFDEFEITGTSTHVTRSGDSLWTLAQRQYKVPVWLIRQYNPDLNFEQLTRGTRITVPQLQRRSDAQKG